MAEKIKGMDPISANEVGQVLADMINPLLENAQKKGKGKAEVELNIKQTTSGGDQVRKDLKKTQKAIDEVAKARKDLKKSLETKSGFDRIISFASPDQIKERIVGSLSAYNDLRFKYPKQYKKDAPKSQMNAIVTDIWSQINSYQAVMGDSKTALSDLSAYVQKQIKDDIDIKEKDLFDTFLRENPNNVRSTVAQYMKDYQNALIVGIKDGEKALIEKVKAAAEKINSDKTGKKNFVPIDVDRLEKDYLDFKTVFEDEEVIKELQKNLQGKDAGKWTNEEIKQAVKKREIRLKNLSQYFLTSTEFESKILSLIKEYNENEAEFDNLLDKYEEDSPEYNEMDEKIQKKSSYLRAAIYRYIAAQENIKNNFSSLLDNNDFMQFYVDYLNESTSYFKSIDTDYRGLLIKDIYNISQLKFDTPDARLSVKEGHYLIDEMNIAREKLRATFVKEAAGDIQQLVALFNKEYTSQAEKGWYIDASGKIGKTIVGDHNSLVSSPNVSNPVSNWHTHPVSSRPSIYEKGEGGDWAVWLKKYFEAPNSFNKGYQNIIPYVGVRGEKDTTIVHLKGIKSKDIPYFAEVLNKISDTVKETKANGKRITAGEQYKILRDAFENKGYNYEDIVQTYLNTEFDALTNELLEQTLSTSKALSDAQQDALNAVQVTTKAIEVQKSKTSTSIPNSPSQRSVTPLPSKSQQNPTPQIKQEAEARQENAEAAREEAKAVEESNEKKFTPYSEKDVLEVVNSKKEKARKFPQHIFKQYGVQESDSLEETLASYISAMEDYKEERDEENARLIKSVTTSYNQIMQKQFESGKGEVPKDFPFKDRKFAEKAVSYLNYQNAERYFNDAINDLRQQIEAVKQAIPTPEEVQEEVNSVISDETSAVSNPPAPRDIMGPFRALTREMIEARLEQLDSIFEDPNKVIEYYKLPKNKKNKNYESAWQKIFKRVSDAFNYDEEINKLIEDSKDSISEYGGYEAASWVIDPSELTFRLQVLKDELTRIKYLEEVVSSFASEYKALTLPEVTSLIDEHSISIPDPDDLFASYGVTSDNRSIETLLEAEQKFVEEREEKQVQLENELVELYNTLAKEGENPFENYRFHQIAGEYQYFQKGTDLFIEEIEHVREEIQLDAEMSRERIRNAIDERLRDIVVDEEQPSIERGELLELAEQRKQATENIAIEQKAEAEKLESNSAVINQERQATEGLRDSTNAATEASKQHTASMAQETAQAENLKNAAQQAADSMKDLNNAKQESASSGGNGAVPPTGGNVGGEAPPPSSGGSGGSGGGRSKKSTAREEDKDLEKLLATMNQVTSAMQELQRLEQESSTNPQPFTDYAFEIEKAKEQLRLYKLELEDLLQTKFHSSSNDLNKDFLDQFSYSDKQKGAFQASFKEMGKAGTDLGVTYMQQAKAILTQYNDEFQRYISMMEGNTTGKFDASLEKQWHTVTQLQSAYRALIAEMNKMKTAGMINIDDAAFEKGMQSLFDSAEKLGSRDTAENIIDAYLKKIESLREQFNTMGDSAPTGFISSLDLMESKLQILQEQIQQGAITWEKFNEAMTSGGYSTDLGMMDNFLNIKPIIDQFEGVASDRIPEFTEKLENLKQKFAELMSTTDPNRIKELSNEMSGLVKELTDLDKIIVHDTGKGTLFDAGQIKSIDDMRQKMDAFAQSAKLGTLQSQKLSADGKTLTRIYQDASGRVYELKGRIDEETQAWRANLQVKSNVNNFIKGFSSSFVGLAKNLTMFISVGRLAMKVRQEFSNGLNTFKEYDKTLTQISYTMNLTKSELSDLGQSAINMAKDLSMSLSNAEAVFQIYANMNTTAEEIQKTAKPTVILSNLSGVDASKAADEVQGILQQFNMLKDSEEDVADVSMHIVDVLDNISANVAMDYAKFNWRLS